MNNSINHKFHHISRAEYQELLAVSRGDAVADYIIDNVSILDLINGGEISGPIVIKGRYIAGVGAEGNDSNLLIVFYVQIMPDDFVMQLHRF